MFKLIDKESNSEWAIIRVAHAGLQGCTVEIMQDCVRKTWLPRTGENVWENDYFKLTIVEYEDLLL
jgi:hypothetical protein